MKAIKKTQKMPIEPLMQPMVAGRWLNSFDRKGNIVRVFVPSN